MVKVTTRIAKHVPTDRSWLPYNSQKYVPLSEISDLHLHNIVYHVNFFPSHYSRFVILDILAYATARGIDVEAAKNKPLPPTEDNPFIPWDYTKGMEGYPMEGYLK